jgi:TctA family transporter
MLGYVLGPMVEENFRRAMLLSRGSLSIFVDRPIALGFLIVGALLVVLQAVFALRASSTRRRVAKQTRLATPEIATATDD